MSTIPNQETPEVVKKPRKPRAPKAQTLIGGESIVYPASVVLTFAPRVTLALRPIKKAFFSMIRRFRVSENISKVEFQLKNGQTITTNFVLDKPKTIGPDMETYLLTENEQTFQIAVESSATIPNLRAVDIVIFYDDENRPVFTQEY
jgi:hypothetical protein